MEQIITEIQSKIDYLKNKYINYENKIRNKEEILENEVWTIADVYLLNDLLNICKYLYTVSYNSVLEQIKENENSIIETYCNEKKEAILKEIPKHKSKYILEELRKDLEKLERIVENKDNFIDSKKQYVTSYENVVNSLSLLGSSAVSKQLINVYFNDSLNPSYKIVLNDLLNGNFENYNKLGKITQIKKINRDFSELCDPIKMWEINNMIDNYFNNDLSNIKEDDLFKEVSAYISNFIKYNDLLKENGIDLPKSQGNYFKNVQSFLSNIKNNNIVEKVSNSLTADYNELKSNLPEEYNDIEYGFFGTSTGVPGVAYYYNSSKRFDEAQNVKYVCELLVSAKELEGKNLNQDIFDQVNQNIEQTIETKISNRIL